jgi:hypothetical protein
MDIKSEIDTPQNRMPDLPIQENALDEKHPNYWTTIVWEPMEHFIHAPKDHDLRYLSREELKRVNWPALRVAWQRHLKRLYKIEGRYLDKGNYVSRISWDIEKEETGENHIYHNWEPPEEVEEYDESRSKNIMEIKEDYLWLRNELVSKLGEYNGDFGLPEDLYN